ncbi:hypothetical protein [Methylorubrum extorquens]|uniref:Uncharacterized protein n=1 Tax=Methylorubrum extorquens DSM 13060 TaxID=882800 RepID=H1KG89_METEX|nr:hypothetical protein [Methylorubrum extorquens]EHP93430.1 hypothetical protein MetexDRAFT_1651 [Methylorubrum extorquens DSM 13060]
MHVTFTGAGRDALDAALSRAPTHWQPMLSAVRDDGCGLVMVAQGRERFVVPTDRPYIVVIGDDMAAALGPGAFHVRSLRRYLARCRLALVVAGAPLAALYGESTARAARQRQDVVIVETRPEREAEWVEHIRRHAPADVGIALATPVAQGRA